MREVRSQHWACGTEVVERVPAQYDLSEGLVLVCPRCRDAWWHYPEVVPDRRRGAVAVQEQPDYPAAPNGAGVTSSEAYAPSPDAGELELSHLGWADQAKAATARRQSTAARLARDWLGPAGIMAALAAVVLWIADSGPQPRQRPSARPHTVTVSGPGYWITRPATWIVFAQGDARVIAPGRTSPVSARVWTARRPSLSLKRAGDLTRSALRRSLPGATVRGPTAVRVGGRAGLEYTATRGTEVRRMAVLAAGPRRFVLELRVPQTAPQRDRDLAEATVRSFRAR